MSKLKKKIKKIVDNAENFGYIIIGSFNYGVGKGKKLRKKLDEKMDK